jgi:hypothetical protein
MPESQASSATESSGAELTTKLPPIGSQVVLIHTLPYLKTADPRPMLRPPDLIDQREVGQVVAHLALGQCSVRFRRGTFLIESRDLRQLSGSPSEPGD